MEADSKYYIFIRTDKKAEEHHEEQGEKKDEKKASKNKSKTINFEKIEVVKGSSDMGYTAITTVNEIQKDADVVVKGAFFVNAKLSNSGEHEH